MLDRVTQDECNEHIGNDEQISDIFATLSHCSIFLDYMSNDMPVPREKGWEGGGLRFCKEC